MDNTTETRDVERARRRAENLANLKKACRLLEIVRREFLTNDWRRYSRIIPQQQYIHLMAVRYDLPCNLATVMRLTGMTSAGASIFVDKMVKLGIFERHDDPRDRRNVVISLTERAQSSLDMLDDRLDKYIYNYFRECEPDDIDALNHATRVVCRILGNVEEKKKENGEEE
ncbi:MAG: winged helix DNA-binding protein [Victivallaceae bacterium]|nr:winged helix DNA-binding protein [Victivallaceae bacterium]